jgi:hypothetical protein
MHKHRYFILASLLVTTMLAASVPAPSTYASPLAGPWINCQNGANNVCYMGGNVGIGTRFPGQKLHIGDGNLLIEGGNETAVKIKLGKTFTSTVSGVSQNPVFELGRIIQAGDGDPEFRFLYSDDNNPERAVLEFDRKGIVASVKTKRGSHFEGFISTTDPEPIFRLNSSPKMRLEMGNGGSAPVDVAMERTTTRTLTFRTNESLTPEPNWVERARITSSGLQITSGYFKLNTNEGIPPLSHCNSANEVGRMKVDRSQPILYVCTAVGWRKMTLPAS